MNNSKSQPLCAISVPSLFCRSWRRLGCLFTVGLIFGMTALVQSVRADVLILDDHFNDPNNNLGLNTNGVGSGFTIFTAVQGGVIETNSFAQTLMRVNGADRAVFCSIDAFP